MPVLALILVVIFLAVVFPLRALRLHRLGQRVRSQGSSRPRPASWWVADGSFLLAFFLLVLGPVGQAAGWLEPVVELPAWRAAPALAVAGAAVGLAVWAQEAMGAAWVTDIVPRSDVGLVTGGPFRWVRNPTYSAMTAIAGASVLLAPNPLATSGGALLCLSVALTARAEEPLLSARFGADYRGYAIGAGRFVPGVGRGTRG